MKRKRNSTLAVFFVSLLSCVLCASATPQNKGASEKLLVALRDADIRTARSLLLGGADANAKDSDGMTALMYAALYTSADSMKMLLDRGADPNAKNNAGLTALMLAAGDLEKVKLLLAKGADVNAKGTFGAPPLMIAAGYARHPDREAAVG